MASSVISIFKPKSSNDRPHLAIVVTSATSWVLLRGQLAFAVESGFDVTVISSPGREMSELCKREGATHVEVTMSRVISPRKDLVSLWELIRYFQRSDVDIVNAGTPKAGLLGTLAGKIAGVDVVVHTLRGLRYQTLEGPKRLLVKLATKASCSLADRVICVGPGLRNVAISDGVTSLENSVVLGSGSSGGIDFGYWKSDAGIAASASTIRTQLGTKPIVGFVGRVCRDKGVQDLLDAWGMVKQPGQLMIVGALDAVDPIDPVYQSMIADNPNITWYRNPGNDMRPYYEAMDFLVLPSYREGFSSVPLQAAAFSKPTIATSVVGSGESVEHGKTGLIVAPGKPSQLAQSIEKYLDDLRLARGHGVAAKALVLKQFEQKFILHLLHNEYFSLLSLKKRKRKVAL